jgi:UDP-glucose 4-epimerase
MDTILITGGFGFLGRAVALKFKSLGFRVVGIGHGHWTAIEAHICGFDYWLESSLSINSFMTLREDFTYIIHCGGNGSVEYSLNYPKQDFLKTVQGTLELLEFMRLSESKALLIYPSSAGVYGVKEDVPIRENDSLNPISPYGYHKRIAEELIESYSRSYKLRVAIIRFFSIYGPGLKKQLIWDASNKLISDEGNVVFWGTGQETRDWIYIDDAVGIIYTATQFSDEFTIVNGASGIRTTIEDTLCLLKYKLKSGAIINFNKIIKLGDPRFYNADISKLNSFGCHQNIKLNEGLDLFVAWYKCVNNEYKQTL